MAFFKIAVWLAFLSLAYISILSIYRLYLSPLAKFPGSKIAAVSWWDEAYHSIFLKGRYAFCIDELHERYGPIVRITPHEVHIKDSSFWEEVFVRRPKADREPSLIARFGGTLSSFTVADAAWHKRLRAPLNPFFSRRSILSQEQLVHDKIELLCEGFKRSQSNDSPISVAEAFSAFTADVISQYSFGFSYGQLESEDFKANMQAIYVAMNQMGHVIVQMPWINTLIMSLPDSVVEKMDPDFGKMLQNKRNLREIVKKIKQDRRRGDNSSESNTIFDALLSSDLPASDKTVARLGDEANTIVGAGIVTTAWALTVALYYILADPDILSKVDAELSKAIPNVSAPDAFNFEKIERLPYFRGCVKEGIRHSYGLTGRLGRVFHEPLVYKDWTIPPGTVVSMSTRDVNFDPVIFEDPEHFKPERWMPGRSVLKDGSTLDRYFLPFSSGPRMCLGINLAYMEMYLVLAHLFRRFTLQLYETDASDVELAHDLFIPSPRLDSKGVRVKVLDVLS